jgi:signal transduction histidine kinase/DNA-binding response OmpR family regulator/HAMP domain-containing protein
MRIRRKFNIILILTGIVPLLIAIFITHFEGISQRKEIIGKTFQQLSEKARDSMAMMLKEDIESIQQLSALPNAIVFLETTSLESDEKSRTDATAIEKKWEKLTEKDLPLKQLLENELAMVLKAFKTVEESFGEILVTDDSGRLVASTNKTSDYWQADEEWWQNAYNKGKGQKYIGKFGYDQSAKVYSLDICIPVFSNDKSHKVVGIIKGVLDISKFFDALDNIDPGEGGKVVLLSDSGKMLVSRKMVPVKETTNPAMIPKPEMGNSGWFLMEGDDNPSMLVGFARISLNKAGVTFNTPWSVLAYQPVSYAFAPVRNMIWMVSIPGIVLILLIFVLGLYIAQKVFISPLRQLTYMAKRMSDSDLHQEVQINTKDEIGELAQSFNQMASNLEKRSSLDNVALNMLSNFKIHDVLNTVVETLKNTFNASFARVWLIGDGDLCDDCIYTDICPNKEKCLHLKVTVGAYAKDDEYFRIPIGALRVGRIAEERKPSMTNDLASDEHLHNVEWLQNEGVVSFAGYPLLIGDELLGVIAIFSQKPISSEEFRMLGSFANRTAMAVQNATLHSEITELNLNLEQKVKDRTQELELANIKLKKADRMKSEFLANMSHELRTPLNAIIGFAEILRDGICGELNEDQKSAVLDIHESGKHLLQMINDILDLSKVEAGRMELQLEEFPILKAMNEIHSIIRDMVNKKGLDLQFLIPDDLPDILADQVKFKQIMYNLLSNAIKFTHQGSITVVAECKDKEFTISVTDTGIGIEPKDSKIIFDEFKQLDSSQSRQYEGTGLGLALTKKLVDMHGGRIWVESEGAGHGSKFIFTIPGIGSTEHIHSEAWIHEMQSASKKKKGKTILVVEDNAPAAQLICIYLTEAGYDTVVINDGEEVIRRAREIKPFAITLDIMLPKKDGWQVMQELKGFPDTSDIPIIIVSIIDDQNLGFSMGAVGYLVKPIDKDQLLNILDKIELEPKRKPKVLIIDDNPEDVRLIKSTFTNEDFDVLIAYDGADGINQAVNYKPDLIILDLLMPGMSGFDVVKALQENPDASKIPIIISTMKELTSEDRKQLNSKVKSIVQKGEDARTHLLEAIRNIERFQKAGV